MGHGKAWTNSSSKAWNKQRERTNRKPMPADDAGAAAGIGVNMRPKINTLPPNLQTFASLLDAQPPKVQEAFQFLLATAMREAGKQARYSAKSKRDRLGKLLAKTIKAHYSTTGMPSYMAVMSPGPVPRCTTTAEGITSLGLSLPTTLTLPAPTKPGNRLPILARSMVFK
jgi:hypothetical protein